MILHVYTILNQLKVSWYNFILYNYVDSNKEDFCSIALPYLPQPVLTSGLVSPQPVPVAWLVQSNSKTVES